MKIASTCTSVGPEELRKVVTNDFHVFWNFTYISISSLMPGLAGMLFYFQQVELIYQRFLPKATKHESISHVVVESHGEIMLLAEKLS